MDRKLFLQSLALLPLSLKSMKLNTLNQLIEPSATSIKMPVLFLGHGSPMNAIEENEFVQGFREAGKNIPLPTAILCISAHWETRGTYVTAMEKPRTIHDFGGFPQALFDVQYPAAGSPTMALETKNMVKNTTIGLDNTWGLDHGAWSVVKHLYPNADVPVFQMSLDINQSPLCHYEIGKELMALRNKGVLIIGSGNMVHNLGLVAWDKLNADNYAYEWALEASIKMKQYIQENNFMALINFKSQGKAFDLAIPSAEHYLPLLYTLALKQENDKLSIFNDKAIGGSLTMTSLKIE